MTLGGNTLKDTSSMLQHKDLLDVGCVCVCMSVFMSERKFWNSELLLYFSTTSGNSASHTQQRNTLPVRKEVFLSFSFKSITVHETVTSLINVEIFLTEFLFHILLVHILKNKTCSFSSRMC